MSDWPATRRPGSWRQRSRWRRILVGVVVGSLIISAVPQLRRVVLGLTAAAVLAAASPTAPDIPDLTTLPAESTITASDGSLLGQLSTPERRVPVRLADLPDHVPLAVLAAEDARFYEHNGVDATGLFRGLGRTLSGRTQGGSTISQQLAKINFTTGERTWLRKFREAQYVTRLEQRYSKTQLLERYMNQVYFGERAYGLGAASQAFFGVDAGALTVPQAATLAGKIRSPDGLDARSEPDRMVERRNQVLTSMHTNGWLSNDQLQSAAQEPLALAPPRLPLPARAPHFVELVKREAQRIPELGTTPELRLARLFAGGYRVETTLDVKTFDATVAAVRATLGQPDDPVTAVASVEPRTGAIRSLFGGLDFASTQFDVSSLGVRQPGSAFKPFVYLAALRAGVDPQSRFDGSSPRRIPCYGDRDVRNYAGEDAHGDLDLDTAMALSVNTVFVELGCLVGVGAVLKAAHDAGVPRDATAAQGAIFLGGLDRGVSALTMATAYAVFASGGVYAAPFAISKIIDADGRVVYEHEQAPVRVFSDEEVGYLNVALQRVVEQGTGRAASIGRPVAGKTGTSQDNLDAWFVGYVPQLATAVWNGFEPKRPMSSVRGRPVTGGSFPARIFAAAMVAALRDTPVVPLPSSADGALPLVVINPTTTTAVPAPATTTPPPPDPTTGPGPAGPSSVPTTNQPNVTTPGSVPSKEP